MDKKMYTFLLLLLIILASANAQWFQVNNGGPADYSTEASAMLPGRRDAAMWCNGDDVYVYGGVGANGKILHDLWKFETETNRWFWEPTPPTAIPVSGPAWTANGRMWMFGNPVWEYNPDTREWTNSTGLPKSEPLSWWMHLPGDTAYVFGGGSWLQRMDLKTATWSPVTTTGTPPVNAGVAAIGLNQDTAYVFESKLYSFDVAAASWVLLNASFPDARTDASLWVAPQQDRLVLFGGRIGGEVMGDTWAYSFESNMWARDSSQGPSQRWGMSTCTNARGDTYVFGGAVANPDKMHNDLWKFGNLNKQNLLEILNFQLDSTSLSAYTAAVMSILIFVTIVTTLIVVVIARCCKRRRDRNYANDIAPLSLASEDAFGVQDI